MVVSEGVMPETRVVSADGTKLAVRCSGSGSPLVMVHGAMGDLNAFALMEETLAERHTVWVYSRRGRGGSGDGVTYTLEREIEDVLAVLDAAGAGAHLFGHSSGAFYSILAAPRARSLQSLSLYEPPLHVDSVDQTIFADVKSAVARGEPEHALETFFPVADITAEEMKLIRAQEAVWQALCRGVLVFPREHQALHADGRKLLSKVELGEIPLLYLYGELTKSPAFLTIGEVGELWPNAQLHCLPGQRHMATVFDPTTFAEALLAFTSAHDE